MNCEHARLLIGADPSALPPELQEHLRECHACDAFRTEMLTLEGRIQRALQDPPPLAARVPSRAAAAPGAGLAPVGAGGEHPARHRGGRGYLGAATQ